MLKLADVLSLIVFAFYLETQNDKVVYAMFFVTHTLVAFYNYKGTQLSYFMVVMVIPIIIFFV